MNRYETAFDTTWESLSIEEAARHTYAIGVSHVLGEQNHDHLARIYDALNSRYEVSVVELAYEEGKRDARQIDGDERVWSTLCGTESSSTDRPEIDIPSLFNRIEMLDGFALDRPSSMDLPSFLKRD